ncbi:MAG: hypothetical protein ACOY9Y_08420 [Bacillota bacterium]
MQKQQSGGISRKLLAWFLILALVPVISVGAINYLNVRNQLTKTTQEQLLIMSRMTSRAIENWLEEKISRIQALARDPVLLSGEDRKIFGLLEFVAGLNPEVEMFFFAGPDGKALLSSGGTVNIRDMDYYQ